MLEVEFNLLSVGLGGFEMSAKIDQSNLKFYLSQIVGYNPRIYFLGLQNHCSW